MRSKNPNISKGGGQLLQGLAGRGEIVTKERKVRPLIGVMVGEVDQPAKATAIADRYRSCPYCVSYTSSGPVVIGVFSLPPDHRWWLEWVERDPEGTLGLKRAEVFFSHVLEVLSPWARGEVKPELAKAPCRADCHDCRSYRKECEGCPATLDYVR